MQLYNLSSVLRSVTPGDKDSKTMLTGQQNSSENDSSDKDSSENTFSLLEIGVELNDSALTEDQKEKVSLIFEKGKDIFSRGPLDLGHTDWSNRNQAYGRNAFQGFIPQNLPCNDRRSS